MYLLTYCYEGEETVGFLNKEQTGIITKEQIADMVQVAIPKRMLDCIDVITQEIANKIRGVIESFQGETIALDQVKIQAPIPYPRRNVFCLGKNYVEHVKEIKRLTGITDSIPEKPIYFSKVAYPAIGQGDTIKEYKDLVDSLDYEVELAVIIGKTCVNVAKEEVEDYIFGYTIANDISARNIQTQHIQWHKGKSFDTYCPMGPYILHGSALPMPWNLEIKSYVNEELRQNSTTDKMIFDIGYVIEDLSKAITLYPGDIILTGTPEGVGAGFQPPKYLKAGDEVTCYIEKIGILKNIVK